jgi:hypothetical protein
MEYAGDPGFEDVDAQWIVDGLNSGGVRFLILWRGHLFVVERDFSSGSIGPGDRGGGVRGGALRHVRPALPADRRGP